jgi:two-component system NarL family response regulator
MPAAQKTIDYRPRGGRHSYGVTNRTSNNVLDKRIQEVLERNPLQNHAAQNNKDPSRGDSRGAVRQSKSEAHGQPEFSAMLGPKTAQLLTILIADDHPLVREGLVAIINRQSDMRVVAEAGNGREAVEKFVVMRPDVALLDLRMPIMDGIEAVMSIYEHAPVARLVIVTTYQSEEEIYRALRAGAQGYVLKDAPVEDLIECIHMVGAGESWIPPTVGAKLARRVTDRPLTAREIEVIRALAKGKSNKEIGVALNISEGTVKVHVTHMLEKLKVTGRTEAIGEAVKRGLVTID